MVRIARSVVLLMLALGSLAVAAPDASAAASCRPGPAAFANPLDPHGSYWASITGLQTQQRGVWAGFAYDGVGDFAVLQWHPGARVRVLDKRQYRNISYSVAKSVSAVGVTPAGAVVANLQARTAQRRWAFAYLHGRRFQLRTPHAWRDVAALSVTTAGPIIGYGTVKPYHYVLVSWHDIHAAPRVLGTIVTHQLGSPAADQHGDIAWSTTTYQTVATFHVRLADGQVRTLASPFPGSGGNLGAAAGAFVTASVNQHVVRWNLSTVPASGPVPVHVVTSGSGLVDAAGVTGAVVWGNDHRSAKIGAAAPIALAGEYRADGPVGEAIAPNNRIAFTGKDRLVHILTCS